jgi:hypothetical protein
MAEHDQRLKTLLKAFPAELAALLFEGWGPRFVFGETPWLEQEIFTDPPHGERRELDLVARLSVRPRVGASAEALVHVEVESGDSVADLRARMPRYHNMLRYKHDLPVLSGAVYLDVALQGRGWDEAVEEFWEEQLGLTRWPYLGLPGLGARAFVEGENLLGVAFSAKMRVEADQSGWLKARALQRIATAELNEHRRHLLMEFVEAYLPLEGPHLEQYQQLLLTVDFKEARMLGKTTFELGVEKGIEKGQLDLLRGQLEERFGVLSETARQRLEALPAERLGPLSRDLVRGKSLVEMGLEDAPGNPGGGG